MGTSASSQNDEKVGFGNSWYCFIFFETNVFETQEIVFGDPNAPAATVPEKQSLAATLRAKSESILARPAKDASGAPAGGSRPPQRNNRNRDFSCWSRRQKKRRKHILKTGNSSISVNLSSVLACSGRKIALPLKSNMKRWTLTPFMNPSSPVVWRKDAQKK